MTQVYKNYMPPKTIVILQSVKFSFYFKILSKPKKKLLESDLEVGFRKCLELFYILWYKKISSVKFYYSWITNITAFKVEFALNLIPF